MDTDSIKGDTVMKIAIPGCFKHLQVRKRKNIQVKMVKRGLSELV